MIMQSLFSEVEWVKSSCRGRLLLADGVSDSDADMFVGYVSLCVFGVMVVLYGNVDEYAGGDSEL